MNVGVSSEDYRTSNILLVSLPWGQIQEIKCMLLVHLTHSLFLTGTQRFYHITDYISRNLHDNRCLIQPSPLLCTCVYLLGEPTSLLVVANTHPPFSLVCQQLPHPLLAPPPLSHPTVPHSSSYIIYTDDISNSSRPRLEQYFRYSYRYWTK